MSYDIPPASLRVTVPLNSQYATLTHTEGIYADGWRVRPLGGETLLSRGVGGAMASYSLLTPVDALYEVTIYGRGQHLTFGVPLLGHLLSCRTNLLRQALVEGMAYPPHLFKRLRTLDALLRPLYALCGLGKLEEAAAILALLTPLCDTCGCGCDGL